MKADPLRASETLIKYLMYLDILFLIIAIFKDYNKTIIISILILNIMFMLMSKGFKKDANKISAYRF